MKDDTDDRSTSTPPSGLTRRQVLKLAGSGVAGAGAAKVGYEYTGFGHLTGTNLTEQRLEPVARRRLAPTSFTLRLSGSRLAFDGETVELRDETGARTATVSVTDAGEDPTRLAEPLSGLVADLRAVERGDIAFEFVGVDAFFDRLADATPRPLTVAALRGGRYRRPSPETVRRFAGVGPRDPAALVDGLAEGFGERTHFDYARYVAGTVQRYLLLGAVPLKRHVHEPTHLDALLDGSSGMYCYEYALRSIEAFQAVPPHRQSIPVFGAIVRDDRHDHAYTGLASVVRGDGNVRVLMTFVDYFYSTLFDNFRLEWAFGDGIDAYDGHHHATSIHYRNPYRRSPSRR
ncbi:hypothetical protein [Halobellus inordinatus]|uniref:hypothetical protein n=1 Tax=Halobellus inordinatus TaxID=1126236 RepID=UPI002113BA98|nr:hypothetical protein [Halobellus ramosii]